MIRLRRARAAALALLLIGTAGCTATPPEPARTWEFGPHLIFFEWDRADLNDRARAIAAAFVTGAKRINTTRIEVGGHADRSGSPDYNQRLSARRANNVAAELVRLGVDRRIIFISAFGETRPLIPTRDGAREPQNRRVELVAR